MNQNAFSIFVFISAMFSGTAAVYAWGRRSSAGAVYLAAMLLCTTIWSAGYSMELTATEKQVLYFWLRVEYLGIAFMPLFILLFAFHYAGLGQFLTPKSLVAMSIIPVITLLLQWTNPWHGLFYSKVDVCLLKGMTLLKTGKGLGYWVNIAYTYTSLFLMAWLLVRMSWRKGALYRRQTLVIVIASLLPWTANVLYLIGLSPFPNLDLSPFTFSVMGILFIFGLFQLHIFNVMPVARSILIENMSDGVLVLNNENILVDINPAGRRLTGLSPATCIGKKIDALLFSWPGFLSSCREKQNFEYRMPGEGDSAQCLDVNVIKLIEPSGRHCGRLMILRNITAQKKLEAEREDLISSLQEALERVKTLKGLLPICANCKKIRDDSGYWHQVEVYFHEHSGTDFSHGLCPECVKTLYPEIYGKIEG